MNFISSTHTAAAAANNGGMGSMWLLIVIYVAIFGALYFFLIRPNSKKNSVEIGDEITTIGGIMGRVIAIKDDEDAIIIETGSDRNKMKMKRWCISSVDTEKEVPTAQAAQKKGLFSGLFKGKSESADKADK